MISSKTYFVVPSVVLTISKLIVHYEDFNTGFEMNRVHFGVRKNDCTTYTYIFFSKFNIMPK